MNTAAERNAREQWLHGARLATIGSAVAILVSIPVSQILLGAAFICLLAGRARFRWPRVFLPLGLFLLWLLVALAFSPDPAAGLPQLKKIYVFLMLPVALAALRNVRDVLAIFWGWLAVASASCLLALGQFGWKFWQARSAGADFYQSYVGQRITGFMSHWMTFSGEAMVVTLLLLSLLLFGPSLTRRQRVFCWAALAVMTAGIVLGFTRGIWIATAVGAMPLLYGYRRWLAIAAPVGFFIALALGPVAVQQRFISIFRPAGEIDSNQHRVVTFATGVEMIKAHPWLGLGPEMVGGQMESYAPAWIRRPFPEGYYGHLHNIYIHYGAERGLPAVAFLLALFAVIFWHQWQALRGLQRGGPSGSTSAKPARSLERFVHLGVVAVTAAILVGGIFEYNLGDSEILTLFLVVIASGYVATPESALLKTDSEVPATQ